MEDKSGTNNPTKAVLEQLLSGVSALEQALKEAEARSQKYARQTESLQQHCEELQGQVEKLEGDYAALRIQKGGFGIRSMSLVGLGGIALGLFAGWVYVNFAPGQSPEELFEHYRRDKLFQYEIMLSKGQQDEVLRLLENDIANQTYAPIKDEIAFARKLLVADQHSQTD